VAMLLFFMLVFVAEAFLLTLGLTYGRRSVSRSPNSSSRQERSPWQSRLLVVLLVGLFSGGWIAVPLLMNAGPVQYIALLFLTIPLLGGFRLATVGHRGHLGSYFLLGLLAGILATFVSTAAGAFAYFSPVDVSTGERFLAVWWPHFLRSPWSLIEVFATTISFVAGGLIGNRKERVRAARSGSHRAPIQAPEHI
jgi:hypothetical protein